MHMHYVIFCVLLLYSGGLVLSGPPPTAAVVHTPIPSPDSAQAQTLSSRTDASHATAILPMMAHDLEDDWIRLDKLKDELEEIVHQEHDFQSGILLATEEPTKIERIQYQHQAPLPTDDDTSFHQGMHSQGENPGEASFQLGIIDGTGLHYHRIRAIDFDAYIVSPRKAYAYASTLDTLFQTEVLGRSLLGMVDRFAKIPGSWSMFGFLPRTDFRITDEGEVRAMLEFRRTW